MKTTALLLTGLLAGFLLTKTFVGHQADQEIQRLAGQNEALLSDQAALQKMMLSHCYMYHNEVMPPKLDFEQVLHYGILFNEVTSALDTTDLLLKR